MCSADEVQSGSGSEDFISVRKGYRLLGCGCRRQVCPGCGPRLGFVVRKKFLRAFTERMRHPFGVTLTVDPELFDSPESAWKYVNEHKLIYRLREKLYRAGCLNSKHCCWTLEFQSHHHEKLGWPHWHVVLDAQFVPFGLIAETWGSFRPEGAPAPEQWPTADNFKGIKPTFGSVRFSANENRDGRAAAFYVTKYLTKHPKDGYPDWVLDCQHRMRFHQGTRGLWESHKADHEEGCFCWECRGGLEAAAYGSEDDESRWDDLEKEDSAAARDSGDEQRELFADEEAAGPGPVVVGAAERPGLRVVKRTLREAVEGCRSICVLVEQEVRRYCDGEYRDMPYRFVAYVPLPFSRVVEHGLCDLEGRPLLLDREEVLSFYRDYGRKCPLEDEWDQAFRSWDAL